MKKYKKDFINELKPSFKFFANLIFFKYLLFSHWTDKKLYIYIYKGFLLYDTYNYEG